MKQRKPLQRRTPLRQQAPLRTTAQATAKVRVKRCKHCRQGFTPASAWQVYCRAEECALAAVDAAKAKRLKDEAKTHREKLADSKPLAHWLALTQSAINALVQARDKGKPCISCGATKAAQWDAGHYLSRGANPALRFDLANIHLQCIGCNRFRSGNQAAYRVALVQRIGLAEVERLEGPHPLAKFTREALAALRRWAAAEKRRIESGTPAAAMQAST